MGENDIVENNFESQDTEKKKLRQKIFRVDETIDILKQRKIEVVRKNDFLNAPKKAALQK